MSHRHLQKRIEPFLQGFDPNARFGEHHYANIRRGNGTLIAVDIMENGHIRVHAVGVDKQIAVGINPRGAPQVPPLRADCTYCTHAGRFSTTFPAWYEGLKGKPYYGFQWHTVDFDAADEAAICECVSWLWKIFGKGEVEEDRPREAHGASSLPPPAPAPAPAVVQVMVSPPSHSAKSVINASWFLLIAICLLSLIPGLGIGTWLIAAPVFLVTFILAIIAMSRGATLQGVLILLATLIGAPVFILVGALFSTAAGVAATVVAAEEARVSAETDKGAAAKTSGAERKQQVYSLNDAVRVGAIEWKLLNARKVNSVEGDFTRISAGSEQTKLVCLEGVVVNRGNTEDMSFIPLYLVDARGRRYGEHDEAALVGGSLAFGSLNPDVPKKFTAIFEVPSSARGLQFEATDLAAFGQKKIPVDLSLD